MRGGGLVIAIVVAAWLLLSAGGVVRGQEEIDLSGDWIVEVVGGGFDLTCAFTVRQSATNLAAQLDCGAVAGTFTGRIESASRRFTLSGDVLIAEVAVEGSVSADGATISGTWNALDFLSGTFEGTRRAPGAARVGVAGEWRLVFVGSGQDCLATIEQLEAALTGSLTCPNQPPAPLAGEVTAAGLTLSATVSGLDGEIIATLGQSSGALAGSWLPASGGPQRTVLGVRLTEGSAPLDLTGQWSTSLSGSFPLSCDSAIEQAGSDLRVLADCGIISSILLTGAVDQATRTFSITSDGGLSAVLLGAFAEDGVSLHGGWAASFGDAPLSGTFVAGRASESPELIDVSGAWTFRFDGKLAGDCSVTIDQPSGELQGSIEVGAAFDCGADANGRLTGGVHAFGGRFWLKGQLGSLDLFLEGETSDGGRLIEGVWYVVAQPPRNRDEIFDAPLSDFGCFVARRPADGSDHECTPPEIHPTIIVERWGSPPEPAPRLTARPLSAAASQQEGMRFTLAGLGGLAGVLVLVGAWRLRAHH